MKPFLRRTARRLAARRSGLSTSDLAQVKQNEMDAAVLGAEQRRRASLPIDLIGPSARVISPLGEEERIALRQLLLPLLSAPQLSPAVWDDDEGAYRGVLLLDPFSPLTQDLANAAPVVEMFKVHKGVIRHITANAVVHYADPDRQLEKWSLAHLLAHADDTEYVRMGGNKPF